MAAASNPLYEISQDERTLSTLAHLLQLVTTWIGPLVILFVKRDSVFVKFHALQALILQICLNALWIVAMGVFMATMFATTPQSGGTTHNAPPPAVFIVLPIFWLVGMSVPG